MTLATDLEDFISLLNKHKVEYMIVGGYALAFHGKPRYTGDLDVWIGISEKNALKMMKVVVDFGLVVLGFKKEDFLKENFITQIGRPPLRIDIINEIDGVEFAEAYRDRMVADVDGLKISYIGLHDFIANKTASGRKKDLADIQELTKQDKKKKKK